MEQQCHLQEKALPSLLATYHLRKNSKRLLHNTLCMLRNCPFTNLPIDIIQYIAAFLPLSSQAALALSSKSLNHAVGNQAWKVLGFFMENKLKRLMERAERTEFLQLLERDLAAKFFYCPGCIVLHPKSAVPPISGDYHYVHCRTLTTNVYNRRYLALCWAHIHLVMQRHFHGKDYGLPLNTLSTRFRMPWYKLANIRNVRSFEMRGKIIFDNLIIKRSYVIDVFHDEALYHLKVCNHLRMGAGLAATQNEDNRFMRRIRCRLSHVGSSRRYCGFCRPRTRRCEWCAVEYDFQVKQFLCDIRLKIEAWVNLGPCQDLDDPRCYGRRADDPLDEALNYQVGDVRLMYEIG